MLVQLDECLLDTESRQLWRGGEPVHVTPKAFRLLEVLLESRPRAISKADLLQKVWPRTFVSETNLASLIGDLRTALGDSARAPRFIRTVHGFGYSFCGEARMQSSAGSKPAQLCHRLTSAGGEFTLAEGENLLGRSPDIMIWLDDPSVSRQHARIVVTQGVATLEDLDSKNGTWLRGERLRSPARLANGDWICCGSVELVYRVFAEPPSTVTRMPAPALTRNPRPRAPSPR